MCARVSIRVLYRAFRTYKLIPSTFDFCNRATVDSSDQSSRRRPSATACHSDITVQFVKTRLLVTRPVGRFLASDSIHTHGVEAASASAP